jgi:hypothetical protein
MTRPASAILLEIEQACLAVDQVINQRRWPEFGPLWRAQKRLTNELEHAFWELPLGSPERQAAAKRVQRIVAYREAQLKRVKAYNAQIAKRLATIGRFRKFSKSFGSEPPKSQLLNSLQ